MLRQLCRRTASLNHSTTSLLFKNNNSLLYSTTTSTFEQPKHTPSSIRIIKEGSLPKPTTQTQNTQEKIQLKPVTKEEIIKNVKAAVHEHANCDDDWMNLSLNDPTLKLKILLACNSNCGRHIPEYAITNITTPQNLIDFFLEHPEDENVRRRVKRVENYFLENKGAIPPNLLFIPSSVNKVINNAKFPNPYAANPFSDLKVKCDPTNAKNEDRQIWRVQPPVKVPEDPYTWKKERKFKNKRIAVQW